MRRQAKEAEDKPEKQKEKRKKTLRGSDSLKES